MSPNPQKVLEDARQLTPDEREWLIESLLIKNGGESEAQISAAWDEEIKRRLDDIDSGAVKMIPHEEVMGDLRAHIAKKRQA